MATAALADSAGNDNAVKADPAAAAAQPDTGSAPSPATGAVARAALKMRNTGSEPRINKLPVSAYSAGPGVILTQTSGVRINCFPGELRSVLRDISAHFGKAVVVTSGQRGSGRGGSYHRRCMAADIQIAGVSPGAIARYARGHGSVGGVGTYGHTRSVHVDVGERVFSWHGGRRRSASLGAGCCPVCAAAEAAATGRRFEAVCTG
jgi:hypothetical protein